MSDPDRARVPTPGRGRGRFGLPAVLVLAVLLVLGVTLWLLTDGSTGRSDALRTGGLAGGSVVALYALWLNDRRRRTEEARHALETERAQLDRDRVADERFAKAVELLGSESDQVRVGAIHALAGLARTRPHYTQTVLDVVCAYLRMPFEHPDHDDPPRDWPAADLAVAQRERQVRRTAERVLTGLLPLVRDTDDDTPGFSVHLTGARIERLYLHNRRVDWLGLQNVLLRQELRLDGAVCRTVHLTGTRFRGPLRAQGAVFRGRLGLAGITAEEPTVWTGADFRGPVDLRGATFRQAVDLTGATFAEPPEAAGAHFAHGRPPELSDQDSPL